jgi:hypothetical protein
MRASALQSGSMACHAQVRCRRATQQARTDLWPQVVRHAETSRVRQRRGSEPAGDPPIFITSGMTKSDACASMACCMSNVPHQFSPH